MDQIKFVPNRSDARNTQPDSTDKSLQKPKNAVSQNIFKSNALKNLSKNMAAPPIVQESKDDSFGDYNDPFEKEAKDFINSQLDIRLSTKSRDEMPSLRHLNIGKQSTEEKRVTEIIIKSYPFVSAKYEKAFTTKKQQIVKMVNEIDCELAGVFGQDSMSFEESLNYIKDERKLRQLMELFNQIKNDDLTLPQSSIHDRQDAYNMNQNTTAGTSGYKPSFSNNAKKSTFLGSIGAAVSSSPNALGQKLPIQDYSQSQSHAPRMTNSRGKPDDQNQNPYSSQTQLNKPVKLSNPMMKDKDRKFTQIGTELLNINSMPPSLNQVSGSNPYGSYDNSKISYGGSGVQGLSSIGRNANAMHIREVPRVENSSQNSQRSNGNGNFAATTNSPYKNYGQIPKIADSNNRDMAMFINNSSQPGENSQYWDALDKGLEQNNNMNPSGPGLLQNKTNPYGSLSAQVLPLAQQAQPPNNKFSKPQMGLKRVGQQALSNSVFQSGFRAMQSPLPTTNEAKEEDFSFNNGSTGTGRIPEQPRGQNLSPPPYVPSQMQNNQNFPSGRDANVQRTTPSIMLTAPFMKNSAKLPTFPNNRSAMEGDMNRENDNAYANPNFGDSIRPSALSNMAASNILGTNSQRDIGRLGGNQNDQANSNKNLLK